MLTIIETIKLALKILLFRAHPSMISAEPKVSVCLPVFNGEVFLSAAIESVLQQSFENFELLIADDSSTDSSWEIVRSYASSDRRIRCWRNETNSGLFANYNRCIEASTGEFIKFFAQDDLLHRENLAEGAGTLANLPAVGLFANKRIWIDDEGDDISEYVKTPECELYLPSNRPLPGLEVVRQCLVNMVNLIGEPSTVMIRGSLVKDGFDTAFHHLGDLDLWLTLLRRSDFVYCDQVLSSFRVHEASSSSVNQRELLMLPDFIRLANKFEDILPELGQSYDKLLLNTSRSLAGHINFLSVTDQIKDSDFRSDTAEERYLAALRMAERTEAESRQKLIEDLLAFRALAFYSLRELGAASVMQAQYRTPIARKIAKMEVKLGTLLNSPSWHATKILRELKARTSVAKPESSTVSSLQTTFVDPESYLSYLEAQVQRIKSSRSWRITRPIRNLGLL